MRVPASPAGDNLSRLTARPLRLGLIADTHTPQRWPGVPNTVSTIFADVDLILHTGDVGELWVLDELSRIAPVVAVHGNDETDDAVRSLPLRQSISVSGHRVVLTHGHHETPGLEAAARRDDRWAPKLDHYANIGKQHGADVVVYGHTHVPMVKRHSGVWLVNPGAIASGGLYTRQTIQTVALMDLKPGKDPSITHVEINRPREVHVPPSDWGAGFDAIRWRYSEPIFEPELLGQVDWLRESLLPIAPEHVMRVVLPLARECWSGQRDHITVADFARAFAQHPETPSALIGALRDRAEFAPYL